MSCYEKYKNCIPIKRADLYAVFKILLETKLCKKSNFFSTKREKCDFDKFRKSAIRRNLME